VRKVRGVLVGAAFAFSFAVVLAVQNTPARPRNIVIFVADGLRAGSVNPTDTPVLWRVRTEGVNFANSHAVYPTLTMPNASAMATGHSPGDTGQFGNNIFPGFPIFDTGNFGRPAGTLVPTVEDDRVLGDLDDHFGGNYLQEESLLSLARAKGYNTAAVGKLGPTAIQDLPELEPQNGRFRQPATIILDPATGTDDGLPLTNETVEMLKAAGLVMRPPVRNQPAGNNTTPGTRSANVVHQQWLVDALTKAILPRFRSSGRPFAVVFWSGDPDQTQHAQGDSLNSLVPGINGPTSKAAVRNADNNLKQILEFLDRDPSLAGDTDLFVTADHGFSTVSRHEIDAQGHLTESYSAKFTYRDATGRQEVNDGYLPTGALAIDLAHALNLPLYDPDSQVDDAKGKKIYQEVDPTIRQQTAAVRQRPSLGNGAIGGTGRIKPPDASVIVTSGSVYVLDTNRDLVPRIVSALSGLDYVGGIFVHDRFGGVPGSLPMSALNLVGAARLPAPAIVVNYRSFATDPRNPLMTSVLVGGVTQQQGQGQHGMLSRANTFNNMAAIGPDFKKGFVDLAPVSNADMAPTLASLMGLKVSGIGSLRGRVIREALAGGPSSTSYQQKISRSKELAGRATILVYQVVGGERYLDEACFQPPAISSGPQPCSAR
jgi:predicted AlkP superfamily pyrophosphatase or phosphodiesterase